MMLLNELIVNYIKELNSKIGKQTSLEFYIVGDQLEIICTAYPVRAFEKPREHSMFVPLDSLVNFDAVIAKFVEALGE